MTVKKGEIMKEYIRILMLGDIIGKTGRNAVGYFLPNLKEKYNFDFVGANGENIAGGFGITDKTVRDVFGKGVDFLTSGNHIFDKKDGLDLLDRDKRIVRPANYPDIVPGKGSTILEKNGIKLGILNLQGRKFLSEVDSPYYIADKELEKFKKEDVNIILVDMHAEVTSEKVALGWYLDGRVSVVVGTHTHVQTADLRILPEGTAYITDLGMCGGRDSVIGMKKDIAINRLLTLMPIRFEVAKGAIMINGIMVDIDKKTGKTIRAERVWEEKE